MGGRLREALAVIIHNSAITAAHEADMEKKTIKKNHIKEFGGRKPRKRPKNKFGTSQGHPGRLGPFVWKFRFKVQNVRGTYDGTDGKCPWDRRDAHQGVFRQNSLCLLVFFFPQCQKQ